MIQANLLMEFWEALLGRNNKMCKQKVVLGLDTSAYTTSLALVDLDGKIILSKRKILEVPLGKRGLRQQEAVFQHIKNYPDLFSSIEIENYDIVAVASTSTPRRVEGSYMPVFEVSKSYGKTLAHTFGVPFFEFSHQEGHIEAGLDNELRDECTFLSYHLSGGTSELLLVTKDRKRYKIELIGGTKDISAGKLVDRIGVAMGLRFPAGKDMESLANKGELDNLKGPVSVSDTWFNLSGAETFLLRKFEDGTSQSDISRAVFDVVIRTIEKTVNNAAKKYKINKVLISGGVAANSILRSKLNVDGIEFYFPPKDYCTDNAVGIARLGVFALKG